MKKLFFMGAILPILTAPASAEDFPIICSIVEPSDTDDKTEEKIGITLDGVVAKLGEGGRWKPRHGNFAIAFKNSAGEMKWIGYAYANSALDKTIRLDALWAKNSILSPHRGYISTYVETVHNGKRTSKLMSVSSASTGYAIPHGASDTGDLRRRMPYSPRNGPGKTQEQAT